MATQLKHWAIEACSKTWSILIGMVWFSIIFCVLTNTPIYL